MKNLLIILAVLLIGCAKEECKTCTLLFYKENQGAIAEKVVRSEHTCDVDYTCAIMQSEPTPLGWLKRIDCE